MIRIYGITGRGSRVLFVINHALMSLDCLAMRRLVLGGEGPNGHPFHPGLPLLIQVAPRETQVADRGRHLHSEEEPVLPGTCLGAIHDVAFNKSSQAQVIPRIPRILVQKSRSASRERSGQVLGSPGAPQMPARMMSSYWLLNCLSGLLRNQALSRSTSCPTLSVNIAGGNAGANGGAPLASTTGRLARIGAW
jgi:hypothetical protein